jgi:hypothetical protein
MKIQIHLTYDQTYQLLEPKAFEKYSESPMQVRMVFADTAYYFEVYDWLTNYSYEICTTVQSLNQFFLEVNDGKGPACKDE